ncbi:MAG: class I SAM-dependent methyltransferase [Actinomycetota bacterium]|nr:class I SAM-dependent methyltransferase [Actinomycetota bacterium]
MVQRAVASGSTVLELGCGAGRLTRPLVALGYDVVAVDESPEMLAQVSGAETVLGDVFDLRLEKLFDAVLAASHFINTPDEERRAALLGACRRHVRPGGVVLVERYEPDWAASPTPSESRLGPLDVVFQPLERSGSGFRGRVTYRMGAAEWIQEFSAAALDDDKLAREAKAQGLHLEGWLDDKRTWGRLSPIRPSPVPTG